MELRDRQEEVTDLRRRLPLGGEVPEDYVFEEEAAGSDRNVRRVRMSELFEDGKDSLILYSFMYGPDMERPCPSCTSILDGLDGTVRHAFQRVNVAAVAKSPIGRIREFARERGWRNLRLLSSAGTTYNADYHAESPDGDQWPALNVFVRRDGRIHHFYNTELLYAATRPGQEPRHVDSIWPLWHLFDQTPEGRGTDWQPALSYR
jgi:predicted dithiol-disulfide oxidoreductase (DUF899 family)